MEQAHEIVTGGNVEAQASPVPQPGAPVTPVPTKEEVMARINAAGAELRKIIVDAKKLPRDRSLASHLDELRCLAQAQNLLQTGLMWLRRAANPTKEF